MKILMLNYEFPPLGGGAANATKYILEEFSKFDDLEIDLVTSSVSGFKVEKLSDNITVHYLNIGKDGNLHYQSQKDLLKYSQKAFFYCRKLKNTKEFDLCHCFFGIPCGFLAMFLGLPYVVSLRGSDVPFYNKRFEKLDKLFFKRLSKQIWKKAKCVVANSKGLRNLALKSSPKQEIEVIYNGVSVDEFKKVDKSKSGVKSEMSEFKVLSVGRLIPRKGFEYLIDSLVGLGSKVSLTIVGDGPLDKELKERSLKKKVNVNFLGNVPHDEVYQIYSSHDVFVLSSISESMSNTVLEAMACSLPVITTNTGPMELIDNNGFVVKIKSVDDIRKHLKILMNDDKLRLDMAEKSREIVESMPWSKIAKEYFEVYEKVLKDK